MPNQINDELILSVIGERPKQALWFCLENDLNFDRKKIPENLEAFEQALQNFFGLGFNFLEMLFIRYLGDALGENLSEYKNFAECVKSVRARAENGTNDSNSDELCDFRVIITKEDQRIHQ